MFSVSRKPPLVSSSNTDAALHFSCSMANSTIQSVRVVLSSRTLPGILWNWKKYVVISNIYRFFCAESVNSCKHKNGRCCRNISEHQPQQQYVMRCAKADTFCPLQIQRSFFIFVQAASTVPAIRLHLVAQPRPTIFSNKSDKAVSTDRMKRNNTGFLQMAIVGFQFQALAKYIQPREAMAAFLP